jgi:hypothetical protein
MAIRKSNYYKRKKAINILPIPELYPEIFSNLIQFDIIHPMSENGTCVLLNCLYLLSLKNRIDPLRRVTLESTLEAGARTNCADCDRKCGPGTITAVYHVTNNFEISANGRGEFKPDNPPSEQTPLRRV